MARKKKYDYYDDSFKATAVELGALPGVHAKDVAKVLDIHPIMLYRWKKEYREGVIMKIPVKSILDTELARDLKRLSWAVMRRSSRLSHVYRKQD